MISTASSGSSPRDRACVPAPIGDARESDGGRARIGDLDAKPLRAQEVGEPRPHLAGAADDQHSLAGATRARGHTPLLLVRQRRADQELHDLDRELRLEPQGSRLRPRAFQHLALPLIIARRHCILDLVGTDLGDDFLARSHETDQLAIDLGETFT
jgi:hypothetical protein